MPTAPIDRIGPFEITGHLGSGGMGVVYRAVDTRLRREVALKLLNEGVAIGDEARARLRREAQAASRVDHPNVGSVFEAGEWQGRPYIVMAVYEGETLSSRLRRGPMPIPEVESILLQVAAGLGAAHAAGVVHRDLKPGNLMITRDGLVKLLDFGVAKVVQEDASTASRLTESGAVLGTLAYMAPEQARGEPVDARADVWALGAIAHEMLTGRSPFAGGSASATLARILTQDPPPLRRERPDVPPWLAALVLRMLARQSGRRPRNGGEVAAWIRARSVPGSRRRRIAAALIVLLVGGGAVAMTLRWLRPVPPAARVSVVSLPCRVFGGEDTKFLADAVPAMLTTELSRVPGLTVQLAPSSSQWDPARKDLQALAVISGASSCLQCRITEQGEEIFLELGVLDVDRSTLRWSQQFRGRTTGYADLVRSAANGARAALVPQSSPLEHAGPPSSSGELALRRGRYYAERYLNGRREADFDAAKEWFRKSLVEDPLQARAASALGTLLLNHLEDGAVRPQSIDEAAASAERALEIDPACGEAWALKAAIASYQSGWALNQRMLEYSLRAASIADSPCRGYGVNPAASLGGALNITSPSLAMAAFIEAGRQDPFDWSPPCEAALQLWQLGRLREAAPLLQKARAIAPDEPHVDVLEALLLQELGRAGEARVLLKRAHAALERGAIEGWWLVQPDLYQAMDEGDAEATARALAAFMLEDACRPIYAYGLASRERYDLAHDLAIRCGRSRAGMNYEALCVNPFLAPLRDDPRLATVKAEAKVRYDEAIDTLLAARARGELPSYLSGALEKALVHRGCP